jgi:surfeit locus 1 family protein
MYFRPLPVLTSIAVPALIALVALGVWQNQRAGEKAQQIAAFAAHMRAPPLTQDQACAEGVSLGQILAPPAASGAMLRVFGHRADGAAGWKHYQAADVCGRPVLVETGFDALAIGGPGAALPQAATTSPPDRFIVTPWPEQPLMAAPNAPERNEWSWFDAPAIIKALGLPTLDTRHVLAPLEGMPDYLVRTPPETHIGYAVTWFGMAIAFAVIYGLMHMRAGRLHFGKASRSGPQDTKAGE